MIYLLSLVQAFYIDLHGDLNSGIQYTKYPFGYESQTKTDNDSKLFIPFSWSLRPEVTLNDHLSFFFTLGTSTPLDITRQNSYIPVVKEIYGFISSDLGKYKIGLFRKKHFGLGTLVNNQADSFNGTNTSSLGFEGTLNLFSSLTVTPFASLFSSQDVNKYGSFTSENTYEVGVSALYKHQAQRFTLGVFVSLFDGEANRHDLTLSHLLATNTPLNTKKIIFYAQKKWHKFAQTLEIPILLGYYEVPSSPRKNIESFAFVSESILDLHPLWKVELLSGYLSGQRSNDSKDFQTMILHQNFSPSYLLFKDNYGTTSYWHNSIFFRLQGKFIYEKWNVRFGSLLALASQQNKDYFLSTNGNNILTQSTRTTTESLQGIEFFVQAKYQWLSQLSLEGFFSYLVLGKYFPENIKNPFTLGALVKFSF